MTSHFRTLAAHPCWGVHWEPHLNLSMNFGEPHLTIREPKPSTARSKAVRLQFAHRNVTVRGEWWLWLFCSRWTLSIRGLDPVRSSGSRRRILRSLRLLDGQRLIQADVSPVNGRSRFEFDLGARLEVRELDDDNDDIWTLYQPDNQVLSVRGDGCFSLGPGDAPAEYLSLSATRGM